METEASRKSFEDIHDDYAFFLEHVTESVSSRAVMLPLVRESLGAHRPLRWLDFGCGGGEFLAGLLEALAAAPDALRLSLVEVDRDYLATARQRVAGFASGEIESREERPARTANQRPGLTVLSLVLGDGLVGAVEFLYQAIELRVAVNLPPGAPGNRITGRSLGPAFSRLELRRRRHFRLLIIRADRAGTQ